METSDIGPVLDALRKNLDPWLGEPKRKRNEGRVTLIYRFETSSKPLQSMRLKIEINSREHFSVLGYISSYFKVDNPWFSGATEITTYYLEELLATKLRALHQRRKGRDLFDLWLALSSMKLDTQKITRAFENYMKHSSLSLSRAEFESTLSKKMKHPSFTGDITPLLASTFEYSQEDAYTLVLSKIASELPGPSIFKSSEKNNPTHDLTTL